MFSNALEDNSLSTESALQQLSSVDKRKAAEHCYDLSSSPDETVGETAAKSYI